MSMMIHSVGKVPLMDAEAFGAAVRDRFGHHARDVSEPGDVWVRYDVVVPGTPGYLVQLLPDRLSIYTDGTDEQCVAVAAWVRSLLPADFPRVILAHQSWDWHVDLTPGITPEQIPSHKVVHDEHWSDPELEGS